MRPLVTMKGRGIVTLALKAIPHPKLISVASWRSQEIDPSNTISRSSVNWMWNEPDRSKSSREFRNVMDASCKAVSGRKRIDRSEDEASCVSVTTSMLRACVS